MSAAPAVHVYPLPDSFNSALMPGRMGFERMYEVEHRIHHNLLRAAVPAEDAHLFFVPVYAAAFFNGRFKAGASQSDAVAETKDFVRAALRLVQQQPYWARRGGSDHVFVFAQDFGRCNLAPPEAGPAIAIQISGDPLPGDGAWGGAQGDFDEPPDPGYDAPLAAAAELRARGEAGAPRCFEAGRDIVVPPLVEPPDALLPALLSSNASVVAAEMSAAAASAAASCDCAWARPAAACDGGDDGTPCWRGCCGVLARFHGAVERLAPSYSFGVRQQLWSHFKEDRAIRLQQGGAQSDNAADYWRELSTSPFCLAPPGHARWSLRMSEAILAGCVPVLFEVGELALPWEAELPYANFSVRLRQVGSLRAALTAAAPRLAELRRALQPARRAFLWSDESEFGPHQRLMRALAARAPRWSLQGAQDAGGGRQLAQDARDARDAASLQPSVVELQQ